MTFSSGCEIFQPEMTFLTGNDGFWDRGNFVPPMLIFIKTGEFKVAGNSLFAYIQSSFSGAFLHLKVMVFINLVEHLLMKNPGNVSDENHQEILATLMYEKCSLVEIFLFSGTACHNCGNPPLAPPKTRLNRAKIGPDLKFFGTYDENEYHGVYTFIKSRFDIKISNLTDSTVHAQNSA